MNCGDPTVRIQAAKEAYETGPPLNTTFLSTTTVVCQPGYEWVDLNVFKNISCEADKNWTLILDCIGFYFHYSHQFSFYYIDAQI